MPARPELVEGRVVRQAHHERVFGPAPSQGRATPCPAEALAGGTITALRRQRRIGAERLNVFLDGQYAFSLAETIASGLHEGQRLNPANIEELWSQDEGERAYGRALRFLAARPRSTTEIRRRLRYGGYSPAAIQGTLARLQRMELADDHQFAEYWVMQRQRFSPRGTRALRAELRQKGIEAEIADAVLVPLAAHQREAAYRAGAKYVRASKAAPGRPLALALAGYLQRRGFDWGVIRAAVGQLVATDAPDH